MRTPGNSGATAARCGVVSLVHRQLGLFAMVAVLVTGCTAGGEEATAPAPPSSASSSTAAPTNTAAPLARAAAEDRADDVARLLRAGADPDEVDRALLAAVRAAGGTGRVDTVRLLVAAGADVPPEALDLAAGRRALQAAIRAARAPGPSDPDGALLAAATSGDADGAAVALRARADLEVRDQHRRTPLLLAVTDDRLDVARLLVGLGADPDALDDRHDTPWLVTGVTGSVEMLEILLPARPDLTIRNRFGGVSVIPASERGHVDYVRRVVRTGIDVNHVNDPGWTALLEAVVYGDGSAPYQEIVRILLAAGADPGIRDAQGRTALQHAEERGQREVAAILRGG
jgi:uncharacterized protein